MSPVPDTQDANSSSVVVASPPASVPVSPAEERAEADAKRQGSVLMENPYLAGLSKKTRGLKKKMEKIKKTESLRASGKHLNEEQIKLLETKPMLEVALAEHERVRVVIEAVSKEQAEREAELVKLPPPSPSRSVLTPALSIPADEPHPEPRANPFSIPAIDPEANASNDNVRDCPGQEDAQTEQFTTSRPAAQSSISTESIGVATDLPQVHDAEAQTDVSGPPPPPGLDPREVSEAVAAAAATAAEEQRKVAEEAESRGLAAGRAEAIGEGVAKLLRLLHVASRFEAKGERLPSAVDFFSKVLLGKTVAPDEADFDGCLDQSVERAILYLDPHNSARDVAPGVNYQRLQEMVAALRDQITNPPAAQGPVFNFFGDASPPRHLQSDSARPEEQGMISRDERALPAAGNERAPVSAATPASVMAPDAIALPLPSPLVPPSCSMAGAVIPSRGSTVEAEPSRSPSARHHERQASEMEEGVLQPVVPQTQPSPSTPSVQMAIPQRERRGTKPRPRPVPVPSYHAVSPAHHYNPQHQHTALSSPPLPHPHHVRSPFQQQPTPPLTPVQMGQSLAPPMPTPSPPTRASPPVAATGGSPNLSYSNGWGYAQQPPQVSHAAPQQQHQQQLKHQHFQQYHPNNGPPLHPPPVTMRSDQSAVAPPWGDPSPPRAGAARIQEALAGGFSLTPEQDSTCNEFRAQPPPLSSVMPAQSTAPPPGQWGHANDTSSLPPTQPPQPTSVLDLEKGMTSPWQGLPQDADATASAGLTNEGPPNETPTVEGSADYAVAEVVNGGQQAFGGAERSVQGRLSHSAHVVSSSATRAPAEQEPQASSIVEPALTPKEHTCDSSTYVANGAPAAAHAAGDIAGASKPPGGNGRGRGSGSHSRGRGRGEQRSHDQINAAVGPRGTGGDKWISITQQSAPGSIAGEMATTVGQQAAKPQNQASRPDQAPRNGKSQRRPREQGRAQPQKQEPAQRSQDQQQQQVHKNGEQRQSPSSTQPHRTTPPQSKGKVFSNRQSLRQGQGQGTAPSALAPKKGWEITNGAAAGHSASSLQTVQAGPAAATASLSWADDDVFVASHPGLQRMAGGGRRSRQSLHHNNSTFSDAQRPNESSGQLSQKRAQDRQWQGSAPSRDNGGRSTGQRQSNGGRSNPTSSVSTTGGIAAVGVSTGPPKPRSQAQVQSRALKAGGASISGSSEGPNQNQNRGQQGDGSPSGTNRAKTQDGGNGRLSNAHGTATVAPQGAGSRKNSAPAVNRRRGNGGRGTPGSSEGRGAQQQQRQPQDAQKRSA